MSNIVMTNRSKPKSPYKALLSSNSRSKLAAETTRKIYLHELPLKRSGGAKSIEEDRHYHSSSRNIKDFQLHLDRHPHRSQTKEPFSDRKNQKESLPRDAHSGRHSKFAKNKLSSSSSKMDKIGEKSTMISTLLSSHQQRQQKLKEDLKRHE